METAAKVPSIAPSTQASSSAPTPPSAPRQVEIAVRTLPPSASIYFDDDLLPSNPAIVIRIADGSLHVVRAEAQGYQARAIEIVLDKGADLVIRLDRAAPAPGHPLSTPTGSARASSPSAKDCNPPYYVDAKGIKKFKPRCL
jgi:hypothetical protein